MEMEAKCYFLVNGDWEFTGEVINFYGGIFNIGETLFMGGTAYEIIDIKDRGNGAEIYLD